jgi:hypothetical protein
MSDVVVAAGNPRDDDVAGRDQVDAYTVNPYSTCMSHDLTAG